MRNSVNAFFLSFLLIFSSMIIPAAAQNADARDHSGTNVDMQTPTIKIGYLHHTGQPYSNAWLAAAQTAIQHSNSMYDMFNFELTVENTNCNADSATLAAQNFISDGVVAVSGGCAFPPSTINATEILSTYSIPMISIGSNLPSLGNNSSYSGLFRLTHSGEVEGHVMSHSLNLTEANNPALVYFSSGDWTNDHYRYAADGFWDAREASENPLTGALSNICRKENHSLSHTDSQDIWRIVQGIRSYDCDSVVIMAGLQTTADIVDELFDQGWSGEIISGHWAASYQLCELTIRCHEVNLINFTDSPENTVKGLFEEDCSTIIGESCSGYNQTSEIYDSVKIIVDSFLDYSYLVGGTEDLESSILRIGDSWEGASGWITFKINGDTLGSGFDQCQFSNQSTNIDYAPNCYSIWAGATAPIDTDNDGWSDVKENSCGSDEQNYFSIPTDFDNDTFCDLRDPDDDNDRIEDLIDHCPYNHYEYLDTDSDGICDNQDDDDDGDGYSDNDERNCNGGNPLNYAIIPDDFDGDKICDSLDEDDDNDGCSDNLDDWPFNDLICLDTDYDGIDNQVDTDDDNDGYPDEIDAFPLNQNEWLDTDEDGIGNDADTDDDNDGKIDAWDPWPLNPCADTDSDGDGMPDYILWDSDGCMGVLIPDDDDDGDGILDIYDLCWTYDHSRDYSDLNGCGPSERDTDDDGFDDSTDWDIDGDGIHNWDDSCSPGVWFYEINLESDGYLLSYRLDRWSGSDYVVLPNLSEWETNWTSNISTDFDTDGCHDEIEDPDDDNDGWNDDTESICGEDDLNASSMPTDTDGDGLCDSFDLDDDGDSIHDQHDNCQISQISWISNSTNDIDSDGCKDDLEDFDLDEDSWQNTQETECNTDPLSSISVPVDNDGDGLCDHIDEDDDNDGWPDNMDRDPLDPAIQTDLDVYIYYSKWIGAILVLGAISYLSQKRRTRKL